MQKLEQIPYVIDRFLPKDRIEMDMNGVWHVGLGTDLDDLVFKVNLTHYDRRFLHGLHILHISTE